MKTLVRVLTGWLAAMAAPLALAAAEPATTYDGKPGPYAQWQNGPGKDSALFPIAVWLQDPRNASNDRREPYRPSKRGPV